MPRWILLPRWANDKTVCAGGTSSAVEGATSVATCSDCFAGTFSSAGASGCTKCEPGTVSSALGSATCQKCDPGSFAERQGTVACTDCPTGKTSAAGSVSRDGCTDIIVSSRQTSVVIDVVLPYSCEAFTEAVQSNFRIGMAAAAKAGCKCEVTKSDEIIPNIQATAAAPGTRRHLSAADITVGVSILVPNLEGGNLLVQSGALSKEGINKELDKLQVERVTSVSSPALSSSASNGNNSSEAAASSQRKFFTCWTHGWRSAWGSGCGSALRLALLPLAQDQELESRPNTLAVLHSRSFVETRISRLLCVKKSRRRSNLG